MAINDNWDKIFKARGWGMRPCAHLLRMLESWKPEKMLEVGCGTGANLLHLASIGIEIHGIDGAPTGIELARGYLKERHPNWRGELHVGDICKLPYPDDTFDLVLDVEAISANSFDDAKLIYAEIHRVLKPGGRMLSITFADDTYTGRMAEGVQTRLSSIDDLKQLLQPIFDKGAFRKFASKLIEDDDMSHLLQQWVIETVK